MKKFVTFALILLFVFAGSTAFSGTATPSTLAVNRWLQLGPVPISLPAFHQIPDLQGKTVSLKDFLDFSFVNTSQWHPKQGARIPWEKGAFLTWKTVECPDDTLTLKISHPLKKAQLYYFALYLRPMRFLKAKIRIASNTMFQAYLDGKSIIKKSRADTQFTRATSESASRAVAMEPGQHLLLIKAIIPAQQNPTVQISTRLELPDYAEPAALKFSTIPDETLTTEKLLNAPRITRLVVSPQGRFVAVRFKQALPPSDKNESWIEIFRLKNGKRFRSFRGILKMKQFEWAPDGRSFSYVTTEDDQTTLWLYDLQSEKTRILARGLKHFSNYTWSPDGSFLVYSIEQPPAKNQTGLKRLKGLEDRWPWWRTRSFLYRLNLPTGTRQRLTAGRLSTRLNAISPDGKKLLFTRSLPNYKERPYSKTQFFILNLEDLHVDSLWNDKWANSAQWSPDGRYLLILGGPDAFDGLGVNLPKNVPANDYDTQAYLYELKSGKLFPVTKKFNPSINHAQWSKDGQTIYFLTTDHAYQHLYAFSVKDKRFSLIPAGGTVVHRFAKASGRPIAAAVVSGPSFPPRLVALDLAKKRFHYLETSLDNFYQELKFGKVENFDFTAGDGLKIEGRIYYPPDFSSQRTYPAIVYYYGGTTPVTRSFGGRYPKELWAANGYVVYVLQPAGAIGFGQAFSALHVNDWGQRVAQEIIDGTRFFLKTHPFVDSSRVGCIGASYGGFMTMSLVSKTSLFAAAVAHAGISSISSYWGEGYWGYLYSAIATANSFPWNRQDIYVNRSPLFNAQNIKTPLLLLHGTADTNVPPGESIQLFTALKLLGRSVEFVEIKGENHHILTYGKRKQWTKTILAWFDKWLKAQPEWWNALYQK